MKGMKGAQPTVPTGQTQPSPVKLPQVDDMAHFHKLATSGALSDILLKLGGGKK